MRSFNKNTFSIYSWVMLTLCVLCGVYVCVCVFGMAYAAHSFALTTLFLHSSNTHTHRHTERKCPTLFRTMCQDNSNICTNSHPCDVMLSGVGKGRKIIYGEHCLYSCVRVYSARETRAKLLRENHFFFFLCIFVLVFFFWSSLCFAVVVVVVAVFFVLSSASLLNSIWIKHAKLQMDRGYYYCYCCV